MCGEWLRGQDGEIVSVQTGLPVDPEGNGVLQADKFFQYVSSTPSARFSVFLK